MIECADPELAVLITHDRTLRARCRLIGDRHVLVPPETELKFRAALRKLGYVLPAQPTA